MDAKPQKINIKVKSESENSFERDELESKFDVHTLRPKIDFKERLTQMSMKNDIESSTFK